MEALFMTHSGQENSLENSSGTRSEELKELVARFEAIVADEEQWRQFLEKKGEDAQHWLDLLQLLADSPAISSQLRSTIFTIMIRLSKNSGCCPKCLVIQNVEKQGEHPVGGGGFGDVWKGTINHAGSVRAVCLKVVRAFLTSDVNRSLKEYLREAIVWKQIKHPNVLPFLGIYYLDNTRKRICLVSPWMDRGDLVQYLKDTPRESVNHLSLVFDVASGLSHLHIMKIVHADLKGVNILMTPSERACIADFGLSRISDTHAHRLSSSSSRTVGTARWLSPELYAANAVTTKASDVYAFACVCYEIFTGLLPFSEYRNDAAVTLQVLAGARPSRPDMLGDSQDAVWNMMDACWKADPSARPSASTIVQEVAAMAPTPIISAPAWDDSMVTEIWSNIEHSTSVNEPLDSSKPLQNGHVDYSSGTNGATGLHIRWIRDQSKRQRASSPARSNTDSEEIHSPKPFNLARLLSERDSRSPRPQSSGSTRSDVSDSYASTSSSVLMRYFPKRFFVVKADSEDAFMRSVESGTWSGGTFDEELERAARTSLEVFLIFAVEKGKEFWGYAKMAGNSESIKHRLSPWLSVSSDVINEEPQLAVDEESPSPAIASSRSRTILPDPIGPAPEKLELSIPESPTSPQLMDDDDETPQAYTPKVRYIEERHTAPGKLGDQQEEWSKPIVSYQFSLDAAMEKLVGSLHAIYYEDNLLDHPDDATEASSQLEGGSVASHVVDDLLTVEFDLEWICTEHLPYTRAFHLRNPWNHSREVRASRDGHELEPGVGQQLVDEWQRYVAEQRAGDRGLPRRRETGSLASSVDFTRGSEHR
ncbi:hypothetical protein PQX77_000737 [Marasmius sp. AFHP31]|nr:hypothetical protein PQX77_000737 [Marasmius sp. AFHP31]